MARYNYTFTSYRDCPEATRISESNARFPLQYGRFLGLVLFASVLFFLITSFQFFTHWNWELLGGAFVFILIAAVMLWWCFVRINHVGPARLEKALLQEQKQGLTEAQIKTGCERIDAAIKKEVIRFSLFYGSAALLSILASFALMALIRGIGFALHGKGVLLLLCAAGALAILGVFVWLLLRPRLAQARQTPKQCPECRELLDGRPRMCPHCGTQLRKAKPLRSHRVLIGFLSIVSVIVFLVLWFDMAPLINGQKDFTYLGGLVVVIALQAGLYLLRRRKPSELLYGAALILSLLLILVPAGLRITYEAKVDRFVADVPETGPVEVMLDLGVVIRGAAPEESKTASAKLSFNGETWPSGSSGTITINESCPVTVEAEFIGSYGSHQYIFPGSAEFTLFVTPEELAEGFSAVVKVPIPTDNTTTKTTAEVTVRFTRDCDFWEVIFY